MKKMFGSVFGLILFFSMTSIVLAATIYWPTESTKINSEFGMRTLDGVTKMHYGLDIGPKTAKVEGNPVKAIHNGVVKSAGFHETYGNVVFINHTGTNQINSKNVQSVYAHLKSTSVTANASVNGNTEIGKMGKTGRVTGVHLHLETRDCPTSACTTKEANATNPKLLFNKVLFSQDNNEFSESDIHESHESEDLSIESPNYYSLEKLAEMTPEELKAIGYPNPYEFQ